MIGSAPDPPSGASDPILAVGVVVVVGGALLLVRRKHEPGTGRWSLPGGRVEPGETLECAARREALEETGLDCEIGALVGTAELPAPGGGRYLVTDFAARPVHADASPVPGSDALEAVFWPGDALGELDLVDGLRAWLLAHGVVPVRY